jgi:hypothetical protein
MAGSRSRTDIMLKAMWSTPACSQPAESTVHQRPKRKTGTEPLAPSTNRLSTPGESREKSPLARIAEGWMASALT